MKSEETIFNEALAIASPQERIAFLRGACGDDAALRQQVEALLDAHQQATGFMQSPAVGLDAVTAAPATESSDSSRADTDAVGATVGPYKLLERIGEGGMGVVYMAEQTRPVRRMVALKIIKPGMDSGQVIARFEAERQALAMMDHPNIARVLDAGTTESGRPYFAMELVKGIPITDYCDQARLSTRQRLELFTDVCHAVQHAHTKGIIHRDLKPGNVLVTLQDDKPVPKVIDFGIAKATGAAGGRLTDRTLFTHFAQMVGTPMYMSPEQAALSATDVDTRSDVYSLGVLLYELLTGTTPFDKQRLGRAAYDEIRRIIREEDPPRPSTRLSTLGQALTTISTQRHTDARKLGQLVRGELDWIVMRSLEKDRARRYETVNAFAADVQRHLNDQPVEACPPSASYRLRKFARRNKPVILSASLIAAALLIGTAVSAWQATLARRQKLEATQQRDQKELALQEREAALTVATRNQRSAEERSAESLLVSGENAMLAGRPALARTTFDRAWDLLDQLGLSTLPAEAGLLECYRMSSAPILGFDAPQDSASGFWKNQGRSAILAPDDRVISAGRDGVLRIWDVRTGRELLAWRQVTSVSELAASTDGRLVLTGGRDGIIHGWDTQSGRLLHSFQSHESAVTSIAISADGKSAAAGGADGRVVVWEIASRRPLAAFSTDASRAICAVAFVEEGNTLLAVGKYDLYRLDLKSGSQLKTRPLPPGPGELQSAQLTAAAVSPDQDSYILASAAKTTNVHLWDIAGRSVRLFMGHFGVATAAAWSPDSRFAATGSSDKSIRVWDVQAGAEHRRFDAQRRTSSIAFLKDSRRILSAGSDGKLRLWDVDAANDVPSFAGHTAAVTGVAYFPNGLLAVSGSRDETARIWDVSTGKTLRVLKGHSDNVARVAVSPDGRFVLTSSFDRTFKLWDVSTGSVVYTLTPGNELFTLSSSSPVCFTPDGSHFIAAGASIIRVFKSADGQPVRDLIGPQKRVFALAVSPNGRELLSTDWNAGLIILWDLQTGQAKLKFGRESNTVSVAFTPDGRTAVTGSWDSTVKHWDLGSGRELRRMFHDLEVYSVAVAPDGNLAVSSSDDTTVALWELSTGKRIGTFRGHDKPVYAGAVSPDGKNILSAGRDSVLRLWALDRPAKYRQMHARLDDARERLTRNQLDVIGLTAYAEWYDFRGQHDWAADFYEKARAEGASISSLALARCYWQLGRLTEAEQEFRRAIERNEAPRDYLMMCLEALADDPAPATSQAEDFERRQ